MKSFKFPTEVFEVYHFDYYNDLVLMRYGEDIETLTPEIIHPDILESIDILTRGYPVTAIGLINRASEKLSKFIIPQLVSKAADLDVTLKHRHAGAANIAAANPKPNVRQLRQCILAYDHIDRVKLFVGHTLSFDANYQFQLKARAPKLLRAHLNIAQTLKDTRNDAFHGFDESILNHYKERAVTDIRDGIYLCIEINQLLP